MRRPRFCRASPRSPWPRPPRGARSRRPTPPRRPRPAAPPDTALLGAEAVRIAGLAWSRWRAAPWREEWTAPRPPRARPRLHADARRRRGGPGRARAAPSRATGCAPGRCWRRSTATRCSTPRRRCAPRRAASLVRAENEARLAASGAARAERLYAAKAALARRPGARPRRRRGRARPGGSPPRPSAARAEEMMAHLVGSGPVPAGVEPHEVLVRAPMDGVVVAREAQPGQVVLVGTPLAHRQPADPPPSSCSILPEEALAAARAAGREVRFAREGPPGAGVAARGHPVGARDRPRHPHRRGLAARGRPRGRAPPRDVRHRAAVGGRRGPRRSPSPPAPCRRWTGRPVLIAAAPRGEGMHLRAVPVGIGPAQRGGGRGAVRRGGGHAAWWWRARPSPRRRSCAGARPGGRPREDAHRLRAPPAPLRAGRGAHADRAGALVA